MIIEVATTIDTTTDFDTGIATYEAWVEWLDEWLLTAPEGMVWHHTRHCNVCVHDTNRTLDGSSDSQDKSEAGTELRRMTQNPMTLPKRYGVSCSPVNHFPNADSQPHCSSLSSVPSSILRESH